MASAAMMTSLGVWTCQWRELRPINFGGSNSNTGSSTAQAGEHSGEGARDEAGGDEETAYGRRGRARGRDGAGEYEMVTMKGEEESV